MHLLLLVLKSAHYSTQGLSKQAHFGATVETGSLYTPVILTKGLLTLKALSF